MTLEQAAQIAELLNTRNQLQNEYDAETVLERSNNFLVELQDGAVAACVEIKKVQWYQWELCHLSVTEELERRGLGKRLIRRAEEKAKQGGARIIQCTIRVGNEASEQAFRRSGYREACCFYNAATDRYVAVWQKVLSHRAAPSTATDPPRDA
jgi:N-acetylglutamate synthase-like GNAT family acetyltransferase